MNQTTANIYRGYLGVTQDVSSQWMNEHQFRETQALLRVAAAAGRLGAWSVELPAMAWTWSDEVKAIHEVPPDFRPGTADAIAFYTPDSREMAMAAFDECAREGTPFDLELQLHTAKGNLRWIRVIGGPERDALGRITHVRGALQDVTKPHAAAQEARRMADRLTRTLETLPDGYLLLDPEWRFVYVNPEAARILRRRRDALIGRSMLAEFPETAAGKFIPSCMRAMAEGITMELEKFYAPLGIWVYIKVCPSDLGLTLCIRDDTERITAQREVLRLRAALAARRPAAAAPGAACAAPAACGRA
jgi:PAS domain S-box-containing protein